MREKISEGADQKILKRFRHVELGDCSVKHNYWNDRCDILVDISSTSYAVGTWFEYGQGHCDQSLNIVAS